MKTKFLKTTYCLGSIIFAMLLATCSNGTKLFVKDASNFYIHDSCVTLNDKNSSTMEIQGAIWYSEDDILHSGDFGLHWIGDNSLDTGVLPVHPVQMIVSPDGKDAVFNGREVGVDIRDSQLYVLSNHEYQKTQFKWFNRSPVWAESNLLIGTDWDFDKQTISTITTNLTTGEVKINDFSTVGMSSEPAAQTSRNGLLTYLWYSNYEGPRLVVYDTITNKEIARYKDITYQIRPSWYGYLLNPQGTHILSISSVKVENFDGRQQEQ